MSGATIGITDIQTRELQIQMAPMRPLISSTDAMSRKDPRKSSLHFVVCSGFKPKGAATNLNVLLCGFFASRGVLLLSAIEFETQGVAGQIKLTAHEAKDWATTPWTMHWVCCA